MNFNKHSKKNNFYTAVIGNEPEELKMAVQSDSSGINTPIHTQTPLIYSIMRCYDEISIILLENGANPNTISKKGHSALRWATYKSNIKIVNALISRNVDINAQNKKTGETALHIAVKQKKISMPIIKSLLNAGAKVSMKQQNGKTVYDYAIEFNQNNDIMLKILREAHNEEQNRRAIFRKYCKNNLNRFYKNIHNNKV